MLLKNTLKYVLLPSVSVAMMVSFAQAQVAEQFKSEDDAVVVLGKRQSYRGDVPLKSMPQSVSVLSGNTLDEMGITELDNALELVPGISNQNNFGGMWDSFAVRGFVGDENMPSGYLVNGYNEGRGFSGPRDVSGVERIEVLKGPSSALFGRGEPGGTVNIITKKPVFEQIGSVDFTYGSYDNYRLQADYSNAITDNLAWRINGAYEESDSFRDTISTKKYTVAPSFLYRLSDDTALTYDFSYIHQEVPFDRGIIALDGNLKTMSTSTFLGEPGDGPVEVNAYNHQIGLDHKINDNWRILFGVGYRRTSLTGYSTEPELSSSRQMLYVDGETVSRNRRYRNYDTVDILPRFELSGNFMTGNFKHHVMFGADYESLEYTVFQKRYRPGSASSQTTVSGNQVNIYNPVYGNLPDTTSLISDYVEEDKSWGVYFQDQIDLTEKVKFRFGGRYDSFKQTYTDHTTSLISKQDITEFSPNVGLVYEPNDMISLYTSYGTGFRPQTGTDASGTPFEPEKTKSYEVGAKGFFFDGKLTGTIALFKMKKDNILTADPVNSGYSIAFGKAESKGIELEVQAELPAQMNLMLAYSYVDAYVTEGFQDKDFGLTVEEGDPLINVAKNSASAVLSKNFKVAGKDANVGAKLVYVGKRLGETATDFYLPEYTLLSVFGSYRPSEHWKISAQINNLTDERYYTASYSKLWITPGTPRTGKITIGYEF